ncbi:Alpha/Beta hydrolase protein [Mycena amicta]|nr:Alpha/Beta hydrolase protein [Mycena amicta]
MAAKTIAPYGTWTSPLSVEDLANADNVAALVDILIDPQTSTVYHIEKRPAENGRNTLVQTETGRDLTSGDWDVRTTVNGYGGAPAIIHEDTVYFSHVRDGRVYRITTPSNGAPEPVTPENQHHKFANFDVFPLKPILLVCAMEDATDTKSPLEVVNSLCILNTRTKTVYPLDSDASFYASPKFSPDGKHMAWIEWDLPDMPWHGSELWIADVIPTAESLSIQNPRLVAGEHGKISVSYPSWFSSDILLFTCDVSGFENPWMFDCTASDSEAKPVFETPIAESFGYGQPPRLGFSPYAVADAPIVVFTAVRDGRSVLYRVNISTGVAELLPCPFAEIHHIRPLRPNQIVFVGTKTDAAPALIRCTLSPEPIYEDLQPNSHGSTLASDYISLPRPMSLQAANADSEQPVHIIYYPPTNPEYAAPDDERPPCILSVHGGPVGFAAQSFNATKQFFTTRGWAWLDVNFGGTSGYGRAYRSRIFGNWGTVDVDDCVLAARSLSSPPHNLIDPKRIVIRGASGGGFAVLAAFSFRAPDTQIFAAGTALYGISDLRLLQKDTHKYESRYLSMLIEDELDPAVLDARSAVFHADKISVPLLILHGDADTAVPKAQAEGIVESIQKRGGVVEYKLYAEEGHGWKRKETIEDAILREWRFYNRVLGVEVAEEPLDRRVT